MRYKIFLFLLLFIQIVSAKEEPILQFSITPDKEVKLFIDDYTLYYKFYKNGSVELSFPKYINESSKFYLNVLKDRLRFTNKKTTYIIYQNIENYKISEVGIIVKVGTKTYKLKGKLNSLKGDLREFDELNLINLKTKEKLLKHYKDRVYNYVYSKNNYKEPRLVYQLNLDNSDITKLTDGYKKIVNIEKLWLGHNKLEKLPDFICKFKNLRTLDLSFNKLTSLPECMGELSNLRVLDIRGNSIKILPKSIKSLKHLEHLIRDKKGKKCK